MISYRRTALLLFALLVPVVVLAVFISGEPSGFNTYYPSSYSTRPGGYKALYQLLEELRLPVSRLRKPYSRLEPRPGALIVVDPHTVPFSKRDMSKLRAWIEKGNLAIVLSGGPRYTPKAPALWISTADTVEGKRTGEYALAQRMGLRVGKSSGDSRTTLPVDSPRLYGVKEISIAREARFTSLPKQWETLVRDESGPVIVARKMGKGEVVAISDSTMACNRDVANADNCRVIPALLLSKGRPEEIMFDEYHHGQALADSFWSYAASSVFVWVLLQICLGCALFFLSRRAALTGRYRPLVQPVGRSSTEYVDSMANLLESSQADSVALDAILRRFLLHVSRKTGIPVKKLEKDPAGQIGTHYPEKADQRRVLEKCQQSIKSGQDTQNTLTLAQQLCRLRSELFQRS